MITLFALVRQIKLPLQNTRKIRRRIYYNKNMARKLLIQLILLAAFLVTAPLGRTASFTSKDNGFTLDVPSGWKQVANPPGAGVLAVEKGDSRIEVKQIDCPTETCIENKITNDLSEIKRKKMQIVGNSYTGEDIKRIEFSTGEPFFYISFYTPKNDFGAGYFLINGQAYSILARNLTYAETDLIFSFISPRVTQPREEETPELEMDLKDPRAYNIAAVPDVAEEAVAAPAEATSNLQPSQKKATPSRLHALKRFKKLNTFISQRMPPYIRQLGHLFDILIILGVLYALLLLGALLLRLWIRPQVQLPAANPNSLYPIRFTRLYGTPSLIFRAKDNQGNILISLSNRWDSLFLLSGILLVVFTFFLLAACGLAEKTQLLTLSTFAYDTIYSICSLLIPLGIVIFFCGVIWSQLVLREISLFDRKGKKAAIVLQKGFGLTTEKYEIYFARSKEVLVVLRRRFVLPRRWQLLTHDGNLLAEIRERSLWRAIARKFCGHLWGFLRADYDITGQMESTGSITNDHAIFNCFTCQLDKPQAINARDLLVLSLLINIRDKDKWYPWFN